MSSGRLVWILVLGVAACGTPGAAPPSSPPPSPSPPPPAPRAARAPAGHYTLGLGPRGHAEMSLSLGISERARQADLPNVPGRASRREFVEDVRCDGVAIHPDPNGWTVPRGCRLLRWRIRVTSTPSAGLDPSTQAAARDDERGWWWLPGAAVFLVPDGLRDRPTLAVETPAELTVHHHLPNAMGLAFQLPPASRVGLVVLGLGDFERRETRHGPTLYRHLVDRPDADLSSLLEAHGGAAGYLLRATGADAPSVVDVYWFGRDGEAGEVSGTSGFGVLATNYFTGEPPEGAPPHATHAPLLTLLHEQFHLLAGGRMPAWANESLAQYHAVRAAEAAGVLETRVAEHLLDPDAGGTNPDQPRAERPRAEERRGDAPRTAEPAPSPRTSLLALQRRWVEQNDSAAYGRFYTMGPPFWLRIDRAIRDGSGGARSLADVTPALADLAYGRDGTPPRRFLEVLEEAGAAEPARITRTYLGWPEPEPGSEPPGEGSPEEG